MEASPLAAPSPASARRQPILTLRMQEIEQELQQHKAATPRPAAGAAGQRAAAPEALVRCMGFCRFFWTCAAGACASLVSRAAEGIITQAWEWLLVWAPLLCQR